MCLEIPLTQTWLVGEIFNVKNNVWLSTRDARDFNVICGFSFPLIEC